MKLPVLKFRSVWYLFSALMIGASVVFLAFWGLKQGVDFTGGSLILVRFDQTRPTIVELQRTLDEAGLQLGSVVIQPVGEQEAQFRLKTINEEQHETFLRVLGERHGQVSEQRFVSVGPVIGEELRRKSIQGMGITLLAILLYVAYAFRKVSAPVQSWKYGVVTIITAFHDVIVPLGVFAFLGWWRGTEIGTPFIAAILTILGYSITDTIVVMDRIRENLQKHTGTFEQIVERSVQQTFLRSFNTSMTTLLTLFAIYFFGGESLHEFTLTLIIGIAIGTYSSIFIASPLLVTWEQLVRKRKTASVTPVARTVV